jgi:N-acetylglucosamine-6-phosphate deacetylase
MSSHEKAEVTGLHYATGKPVKIQRGKAGLSVEDADADKGIQNWIAPPLFDAQVNGYGGIDFQRDNLSADDLLSAARKLREAGCTRFLLTLITDEWTLLTARLRHLRALRSEVPELRDAVAGWHIEGPFLSSEPGFHGAHNPALMRDPSPQSIRELREITETDPLLLTLSPERNGALKSIETARSLGIKISLGHTNASAEVLRDAVKAGATSFTHLGNGCPRELDRHDNILWRVFETPGLMIGVIPDRIHVSPALFRLMHRVLPPDSIYYVTDAMSAAGMPPGKYPLGKLDLEVGPDQIVRQPGKPLFAGSALRPIDGVFRAAEMLGCEWQKVWDKFSEAPLRLMGLANQVSPKPFDAVCAVRANAANTFNSVAVIPIQSATEMPGKE